MSNPPQLPCTSALPGPGDGSNLVFLVGCPRSGTTWLQRLLASHPAVVTGQESNLFKDHISPQMRAYEAGLASARGGLGLACYFTAAEFEQTMRATLGLLLQPMLGQLKPGQVFLEKTPQHALSIAHIHTLLPRAKVIHLLRDPRDAVASLLAASRGWGSSWAPGDAGEAAQWWLQHVRAAREGGAHLPAGQFLELRYETMLDEPEKYLRQALEFLGLEWAEADLQAAVAANAAGGDKAKGTNRGGSGGQSIGMPNAPLQNGEDSQGTEIALKGEAARQGDDKVCEPEGFVRRATSGGWREDLTERDQFRVWRLLYPEMRQFGYDWPAAETRKFALKKAVRQLVRRKGPMA